MFNKFIYQNEYFKGHRFGIKYYNGMFLNSRFRIFFFLLESFCLNGCNFFFLGDHRRINSRFFLDLSKFYFLLNRQFFFRGSLTNESLHPHLNTLVFKNLNNLKFNLLIENQNLDYLFFFNLGLISNLKRNIFLIFGDSLDKARYDLIISQYNIILFIGFSGISLYYDTHRLFLDFSNENTFKYLQFLVFFLLNLTTLSKNQYHKFEFFFNLYNIVRWKKVNFYSNKFFFQYYECNFVKLPYSEKGIQLRFTKLQNITQFYNAQVWNSLQLFCLKPVFTVALVNTKFSSWVKLNYLWLFSFFFFFKLLYSYKQFLIKYPIWSIINSFFFQTIKPISLDLLKKVNISQRYSNLINHTWRNTYFFKNLKITDLNYFYSSFAWSSNIFDSFFLYRSYSSKILLWSLFSLSKLSFLLLKFFNLTFYLLTFELKEFFKIKTNSLKTNFISFFFQHFFFCFEKAWIFEQCGVLYVSFSFNNSYAFFLLKRTFCNFKKYFVFYYYFYLLFFKCGAPIFLLKHDQNEHILLYANLLKAPGWGGLLSFQTSFKSSQIFWKFAKMQNIFFSIAVYSKYFLQTRLNYYFYLFFFFLKFFYQKNSFFCFYKYHNFYYISFFIHYLFFQKAKVLAEFSE